MRACTWLTQVDGEIDDPAEPCRPAEARAEAACAGAVVRGAGFSWVGWITRLWGISFGCLTGFTFGVGVRTASGFGIIGRSGTTIFSGSTTSSGSDSVINGPGGASTKLSDGSESDTGASSIMTASGGAPAASE